MLRRSLFLALLSIWMAIPAFAVNDWGLAGSACQNGSNVGGGGLICFDFDSTISPASTSFSVNSPSALACLKPDDTTAGAATATAAITYAMWGSTAAAANGIPACAQAGCTLTGATGVPAAQLACVVLGPGPYRVDFVAPAGGQLAIFTVQGSPQ